MIPVRVNALPAVLRTFDAPSPALMGTACPACDHLMLAAPVALIHVGPGDDPEEQVKARDGRWHTGAAVAVHAACAGVEHIDEHKEPPL